MYTYIQGQDLANYIFIPVPEQEHICCQRRTKNAIIYLGRYLYSKSREAGKFFTALDSNGWISDGSEGFKGLKD